MKLRVPLIKYIFTLAAITVVYSVVAKFSLQFAIVNPSASPIWPPTGIAMAALLILGFEVWPAIFLGAFLTNVTTAGTLLSSLGIGVGNTLEAVVGVYLFKRFAHGVQAFDHPRDVFGFAVYGGLAGTIIAATTGVTSLAIVGSVPWNEYFPVWFTWWMGDIGGAWIITPALLLWYANPGIIWRGAKLLELVALFIVTFCAGASIFSGFLPYPYLVIPVLLWGAIRFGPKETSTAMLIIAMVAIWYTSHGLGPYVTDGNVTNKSLLLLQMYVGIMSLTQLIVASVVRERTQAESTLKNLEHRFRALIEKNTDVINLIDTQSNLLYVSPSVQQVLGYQPQELVGTVGFSLVHADDLKIAIETLGRIASHANASASVEIRLRRKDGTWVWVEAIGTNLLHDPVIHAIVINYRDIDQRKELEQSKNEFLLIAAHQLRSPLTAIRWNMELLRQKTITLPPAAKTKLEQIYEQNLIMIQLVNQILAVSRIIQGNSPNNPKPARIDEIIENEIKAALALAAKTHIAISFTPPRSVPKLMIDTHRASEVVQNLLSNAVKYNTPGGTITITIQKKLSVISIDITDTGIGIPKDEQHKLFTKFFRASNAVAQDSNGTGLGLFIAQSYIKGWGGSMSVESPTGPKGSGTRITFTIPMQKSGTVEKEVNDEKNSHD